jgi:transposase
MLNLGRASLRVYLAVGSTDLRKAFDGLEGVIRGKMESDPLSGHLFVFCNRTKSRIKVLYFDGSGTWVCAKRLEKGRFDWPDPIGEVSKIILNATEFAALVDGLQLTQTRAKIWWRKKITENTGAALK